MQILNQIGHIQYWGLSPATNILQFYHQQSLAEPLRILMSGCSDIRHILKTLCDINAEQISTGKRKYNKIEIYFHQVNKQLLCRCLLFLHIIHQTHLNFDERIQIFLDLYGNAMIKERNARYLHNLREDLLNFIHGEKNILTPIKKIVNLKLLKFQERDEMSEMIESWSTKIPFDMVKFRDQKLRFLYKQRYDYRANLVDWDYNMHLIDCAPIVHYYHYKEWRLTGLAFQQRFSTYCQPNRTLASYVPGKKKEDKTSCLVRGYWGDIVASPYLAMGIRCDYKQHELLFKKANYKFIGHSVEITEYNLNYWLMMLEKQEEYQKTFRDYYRADEQTKKKLQEKDEIKKKSKNELKAIKEQQQQIKQQKEDEKGEEEQDKQAKQEQVKKQIKQLDSDEQQQKKKVDLINSKEIICQQKDRQILKGFTNYNLSIHPMGLSTQNLLKGKFNQNFDIVVLGFIHSAYLNKKVSNLVKKGGLLVTEKATYLIPKKKEQRAQLNNKLKDLHEQEKTIQFKQETSDFLVYHKL